MKNLLFIMFVGLFTLSSCSHWKMSCCKDKCEKNSCKKEEKCKENCHDEKNKKNETKASEESSHKKH